MTEIKGIVTPIITPMNPDESINEEELRRQVRRQLEAGIHGIFCFGTNGEGYILSEQEKRQVLKTVVDEVRGRVPVYAGTGCISTRDTIRQSVMAENLGADVLSIIVPSFAAASQEELYRHYKKISEAVDLPIVLYNIPARTGNALTPETVERLSEIPKIVGVKDSSGNFDNMLQYLERTRKREDFAVLSGNDSLIFWNLMAGGAGAIAGCANVYPRHMASIYELFQAGKQKEAKQAQDAVRNFRNCFRYGNPNTIVKAAVELSGYPVGKCRAPFCLVSEEGLEAIRHVLEEDWKKGMA